MKIGIYNRWLPTLGGGERYSLAIASHLARSHDVCVISHTEVERDRVAARVDLDLDEVRFRAVPLRTHGEPGGFSAGYDLFINASHGDFVPSCAPRSAMVVFFPMMPPVKLRHRIRRYLAGRIKRFGMQPSYVNGVFGLVERDGVPSHALAPRAEILLPATPFRPLRVELAVAAASPSVTGATITLEREPVATVDLEASRGYVPVTLTVPPGGQRVLAIVAKGAPAEKGACLYLAPIRFDSAGWRLYHRAFETRLPELGARLHNILPANLIDIVAGYDLLWAISLYSQRWIEAYWNLPSTLLYPPVALERFPPGSKRNRILSVGRFFDGSHNKKHLVMVHAFRRLVQEGLTDWELHLAGGLTPGQRHRDYLHEVRRAAQGLPIHIHVDAEPDRLADLYATSSIYWHAAGHGESPTERPDKFEHFGISVVEAMTAGCAPVVVGQGGLTELVRHEHDGYLWYTTGELGKYTKMLAKDPALCGRIGQAAMVSSQRFGQAQFGARLDSSLAPLMNR